MTSATIVLEIPEDRNGREYRFEGRGVFKYVTPNTTIPQDVRYVSIYSHLDGGVNSLGEELVMGDKGFDAIMSRIICGGDCTYPGSPYRGNRGEDWEHDKPKFSSELPEVTEDYQYVYKTDNKWYVRCKYDSKYENLTCISNTVNQVSEAVSEIENDIECLKYDVINRVENIYEKLNKLKVVVKKIEKDNK